VLTVETPGICSDTPGICSDTPGICSRDLLPGFAPGICSRNIICFKIYVFVFRVFIAQVHSSIETLAPIWFGVAYLERTLVRRP
jgi:hypothetical protein